MNLRWFVKVDGTKVLQQRGWDREKELWFEVPVVEGEWKGREWWIRSVAGTITVENRKDPILNGTWVKVREVFE